ncbi:MAG: MFS transporter [Micrococcales bacterium]|nr:MFS transporter [Micrococcales bacterium]
MSNVITDPDLRATSAPARVQTRAALAVAMFGFAVVTLDAQVTNVALPAIRGELGGDLSGLQWVVSGYTLMFSALLLFGGTVADRIGSRAAYRGGMVLFVLASIACGFAPSLPVLIVARLVQGIGAALVTPTSLSLIREAFDNPRERAHAIGMWAVGGSVAAAAGPIVGGLLAAVDWRLIFFLNLPVGLVALFFLRRVAQSPRRPARFDLPGQITAIVGLAALTFACIEGGTLGFASPVIIGAFVLAAVALVAFVAVQARSTHPMVPLTLFRSRALTVALLVAFISMAGFYGLVFLQSLYFQQLRGYSALVTGFLFLPMTGITAITNSQVSRIAHRFGPIVPIVLGQIMMIVGLVALVLMPTDLSVWAVAGLMAVVGIGGGFTVPPIAALILEVAPGALAGTASGVLNTFRQMGGSLGVAVFGSIVSASSAFIVGLRIDYVVIAVLVAVTTVGALVVLRKPERTTAQ